jgi:TRAP-type mannitol/chloroaromatic compound transport system substrate-binding protein
LSISVHPTIQLLEIISGGELMKIKRLIVFLLVFALLASITACGGNSEQAAQSSDSGEQQTQQVQKKKWRYQTIWVPSITLWRGDKYFGDLVNRLADDLELEYYEGGTLITTSDEMFDAVSKGVIEMGTDWPSYWAGKNTAFDLITSVPMGFNPQDYMIWYWQGGGFELAQELYGKYNIVWFPHSITSPESGQRTNVPVYTADDYKDIKMRQCGRNQANILQDLGGAAIFMPGAEIYLGLQRGTIEGAEFGVPETDWAMGFQEVTKYWVAPGWHQPGPLSGVMVNKQAWDTLSDKTKFLFKEAAMASMMWAWTFFEYSAVEYTNRFLEAGTTITRLDDDSLNRIQEMAYNYLLKDAEENPDHCKIAFSQIKFLYQMKEYRELQEPFMFGRTPPNIDEVYAKLEELAKQHGVYDSVIELEKTVRKRMEAQEFWKEGTPYEMNPIIP